MFAVLVCVGVLACAGMGVGVEVRVSGGVVRGGTRTSKSGREYYAFSAIPYARPPIGRLRFMPPEPGVSWAGIRDAREPRPPCAQAALGITEGVEDCLNLYVYTPKVSGVGVGGNVSVPVVVWLHGGAFVVGGAAPLQEYIIMDRDVVLVVPQYRLGLLGFLHTPTGSSTGNMGMLDQVLALQWVKDNIGAFGGDAGRVTLAGDCAGGAGALYHMLSPLSTGLFHRVLSLSGTPLAPWSQYSRNHRFLLILCNQVRCPAHDQHLTVKCLQETNVTELLDPVQMLCEARDPVVGNHRLAPCVQSPTTTPTEALFLPQHPLHALTHTPESPVPVLMSITKDVGAHLVDMLLYDFILYKLEDDKDFLPKLIPMLLKESLIQDPDTHIEEFQQYYFPGVTWNNLTAILPGLTQLLGDIHFRAGVLQVASLLAQHTPTYVMRYEFSGGPSLFNQRHPDPLTAPPLPPPVGHGDEMALLLPEQRYLYTSEQEDAITHLLNVLEAFVYGRSPREDWPTFDPQTESTLVFTDNRDFDTQRFAAPDTTSMLLNIHNYLHHSVIEGGGEGEDDFVIVGGDDGGGGGDGGGRDEL